jgi:hypothetical protein
MRTSHIHKTLANLQNQPLQKPQFTQAVKLSYKW